MFLKYAYTDMKYTNGSIHWSAQTDSKNENGGKAFNVVLDLEIDTIKMLVDDQNEGFLFIAFSQNANKTIFKGVVRVSKSDIEANSFEWYNFNEKNIDALYIFSWEDKGLFFENIKLRYNLRAGQTIDFTMIDNHNYKENNERDASLKIDTSTIHLNIKQLNIHAVAYYF
jgi:hypothetical protein